MTIITIKNSNTMKNLILITILTFTLNLCFAQLHVVKPSGNTGIGIDAPKAKLDVNGNTILRGADLRVGTAVISDAAVFLRMGLGRSEIGDAVLELHTGDSGSSTGMFSSGFNAYGEESFYTSIHHTKQGSLLFRTVDQNADIKFLTQNNKNRLTIKGGGNVGIGTDNPTDKLSVNGNVRVLGNKMLLGSDAAPINTFIDLKNGLPGDGAFKTAGRFIADKKGNVSFMSGSTGDFTLRTWNPTSGISFTTNGASRFRINHSGVIEMGPKIVANNVLNNSTILSVNGNAQKTGGGSWEVLSDKRLKTDIEDYEKGLNEILKINPVTYKYTGTAGVADTKKTHVGLIAQDFQKIDPNAIGTYKHTENMKVADSMEELMEGDIKKMADLKVIDEYLTIDNSSITYMLVNAIKEQQALIETQQKLAQTQQDEIENLKTQITQLSSNNVSPVRPQSNQTNVLLEGNGTERALLAQNMPNPFTTNTKIEYFIPENSNNCRISFRDLKGSEIKRVDIDHNGLGTIELTTKDLAAGIYAYVLYINGDIADSKKMIIKQ